MPHDLDFLTYTRCDKCEQELPESVRAFHPPLCDSCDASEVAFFEEREAIRAQYLRDGDENPYALDDEASPEDSAADELLADRDDQCGEDEDSETDTTELPDGFFGDDDDDELEG